MNKRTKLFTEKVWKDEKPARKIVGWENIIGWMSLPLEYQCTEGPYPYYYGYHRHRDEMFLREHAEKSYEIHKGDVFSEDQFNHIVALMKRSGYRLHKIMEDEKKAKWSGTETVEI